MKNSSPQVQHERKEERTRRSADSAMHIEYHQCLRKKRRNSRIIFERKKNYESGREVEHKCKKKEFKGRQNITRLCDTKAIMEHNGMNRDGNEFLHVSCKATHLHF